jgi:hypothetical protein
MNRFRIRPRPPRADHPPFAQDHRIHMSESDFKDITRNGALCDAEGMIGLREFETIVRAEVRVSEVLFVLNASR